jgi:fatty-acyl-CoA synthase
MGGATLGTVLNAHAANRAEVDALVFGDRRLTYRQLREEVRQLAKGLLALGVQRGDRVAVWLPNSIDWLVLDLAATSVGCVFVALNTWYTAPELGHALAHSETNVLVVAGRYRSHDYESEFATLVAAAAGTDTDAGPGRFAGLPHLRQVVSLTPDFAGATHSLDEVRALGRAVPDVEWDAAVEAVDGEDVAYLLFTSGSTALPKAVPLVHRHLIENGLGIGSRLRLRDTDRFWFGTPLFFALGCANSYMAAFGAGVSYVLQDDLAPEAIRRTLIDEGCTVFYASNKISAALLDHTADLSGLTLRTGVTSGAAAIRAAVDRLGITEICNAYGMTETYGVCTMTDATDPLDVRAQWSGTALPGTEVRIVDPDSGTLLAPGQDGEIQVRGHVLAGYYRDHERTAAAFTEDGFFRTGDLGRQDAAGRVQWVSRLDDMIKTGGLSVAPAEVEAVLDRLDGIKRSYVVGLRDATNGQLVAAFIETEDGIILTADEVRAWCTGKLASYKIPRLVQSISAEEVPFTATGKVRKRAFVERHQQATG